MSNWVKIVDRLIKEDTGRRIRCKSSGTIYTVNRIDPGFITFKCGLGQKYFTYDNYIKNNYEIEVKEPPSISFSAAGTDTLHFDGLEGAPGKQQKEKQHSCYLDGHEFVDTGMLKSWCKHCDRDAEWNNGAGCFRVV